MQLDIKMENFKDLKKLLSQKEQEIRIGWFGKNKPRKEGQLTNAEVMASNHFGSIAKKIPRRSPFVGFYEETEMAKLQKKTSLLLKKYFKSGKLNPKSFAALLEQIGILGENVVIEAFETQGFGKWPANSLLTLALKKEKGLSDKVMQATLQAKNGITSAVIKK